MKPESEDIIIFDSQLFGIKKNKRSPKKDDAPEFDICRIKVDSHAQDRICKMFSGLISELLSKEEIDFKPGYNPDEDEIHVIRNFALPESISDAFKNSANVVRYVPENRKQNHVEKDINSIFVGCETESGYVIGFQAIENNQYLQNKFTLFLDRETFTEDNRPALVIPEKLACFYLNGSLYFRNYHTARKVLNLKEVYRKATDEELAAFKEHEHLAFENLVNFDKGVTEWIRRRVVEISETKVFEKYTVSQIEQIAKESKTDCITVCEGRIVIPDNKEGIKLILSFLVEGAYNGPFTNSTYIANSKRSVRIPLP